jgi:hypothetical protein
LSFAGKKARSDEKRRDNSNELHLKDSGDGVNGFGLKAEWSLFDLRMRKGLQIMKD